MTSWLDVEQYLQGYEVNDADAYGSLCIKQPWPGMARTIYNDHDRFVKTYFKANKHGQNRGK